MVRSNPISEMSARTVIEELRQLFATHGLPNTIVSDNAAQFVFVEFQQFLKEAELDMLELSRFIRHQIDKQIGWSAGQRMLCRKWFTEAGNSCPATIVAKTGPVSYEVRTTDGQLWKRHLDQLRKRHPFIEVTEDTEPNVHKTLQSNLADNPSSSEQEDCQQLTEKSPSAVIEPIAEAITETIVEQSNRPPRTCRKPKWMEDYVI
ncbi:hypothetical protein T4D_3893 [Trichinella pseudospiralis]|uniref:Integrase catalytic domain-containing protein n=1 Tax=Trichinella pseudospiralis TaxID=6337 RepID=A0A0V1F7S3_TRIPS|nr:hypothetical protein T4D_3893 [Trichinella pseudospiralis]